MGFLNPRNCKIYICSYFDDAFNFIKSNKLSHHKCWLSNSKRVSSQPVKSKVQNSNHQFRVLLQSNADSWTFGDKNRRYRSKLKSVIIEEILKESLDFASIRAEWQILKFRTILKPSRIEEVHTERKFVLCNRRSQKWQDHFPPWASQTRFVWLAYGS